MPPKRQFTGKFNKKPFKRSYNNDDDDSSPKRFKSTNPSAGSSSSVAKPPDGARHTDEEGNFFWELGGKSRRVTVSEFKGNVLVSVREYYEKDGKSLPGKKGISMTLDQFNQLIRVLPALEEAIGQKSSSGVVRPIYTTSAKHDAPEEKTSLEAAGEEDTAVAPKQEDAEEDAEETAGDIEEEPKKTVIRKPVAKRQKEKSKAIIDSEDDEEEEFEVEESEED
ncbi:hypothetical protein H072_1770 [Dactylellina haptotyla CBS 200.50]|uniref:Transcriptional coactivator p15 (PC4) C-terminal domain-containing protein n=1 Tax=Dactylellina haptotyla (strain CBS 200.50) TaxID=1284197 RepID=S8AN27_DACHA|nr:hypothetical protein H072_1770 [Dactylellina haptotyla CBS 200.50]